MCARMVLNNTRELQSSESHLNRSHHGLVKGIKEMGEERKKERKRAPIFSFKGTSSYENFMHVKSTEVDAKIM